MPVIHDYECLECGGTFEALVNPDDKSLKECPSCSGESRRVYLKASVPNNDGAPGYILEAVSVANKDGGRHCQEFIRNPTRATFKEWMKGEGLRKVERGEKLGIHRPTKEQKAEQKRRGVNQLLAMKQKREAINVGG